MSEVEYERKSAKQDPRLIRGSLQGYIILQFGGISLIYYLQVWISLGKKGGGESTDKIGISEFSSFLR
jgi:hypothetical protein